ncbi:MAG: hypothetical protein IM526_12805 [Microcystis sp. M38BS1]|uniref:hypothetical protein n=1 Tax=Microcystis sp. M38BS1 TaxID=2771188 RepID=UPI0031FC7425|nr:hypothetical protein [Microcystis sp. M38BS1]MCA6584461.1 hypothetical protein [Pseudanabaena sp. M34BS1SP1A06MG]
MLAEKEGVLCIPYNEHSLAQTKEFAWIERLVSYPIWATPKDVNPKNISQQLQKVLDKAIEKNISLASIKDLFLKLKQVNNLFGFETQRLEHYEALLKESTEKERVIRLTQAEYHLKKYQELITS